MKILSMIELNITHGGRKDCVYWVAIKPRDNWQMLRSVICITPKDCQIMCCNSIIWQCSGWEFYDDTQKYVGKGDIVDRKRVGSRILLVKGACD